VSICKLNQIACGKIQASTSLRIIRAGLGALKNGCPAYNCLQLEAVNEQLRKACHHTLTQLVRHGRRDAFTTSTLGLRLAPGGVLVRLMLSLT
jgi:hypothetical protein